MQVKTYVGSSASEVMARIKAELGPEAIILGTHTRKNGGQAQVEIMAARELPQPPAAPAANEPSTPAAPSHDIHSLRDEWELLRRHLMVALEPKLTAGLTPKQCTVLESLEREGVSASARLLVAERFRTAPTTPILALLEAIVPVRPWLAGPWPNAVHVFAGPPGAGTTSVVLRLALRLKRACPGTRILLVHAAENQSRLILRHFAGLSGLEFRDAAQDGWPEAHTFDTLLVDAPPHGLPPSMPHELRTQSSLHLVLSPIFSSAYTQRFVDRILRPEAASIIWTKLDEACNFGEIMNQALTTNLPVSLVSVGKEIKNTLREPTARDIWRLILRHELPNSNLAQTN